jgi:dienelactone hydrolase
MQVAKLLWSTLLGRSAIALVVASLFITGLFWAKARDPFRRVEFSLITAHGKVSGMAVLPRRSKSFPTVIFLHGAGGSVLQSGNDLRLFAEQNLAAVDIEYSQISQGFYDEEFIALQNYLARQNWAMKAVPGVESSMHNNAPSPEPPPLALVGFSMGSQRTFSFLLRHPEFKPRLYVRIAGGWVDELGKGAANISDEDHKLETASIIKLPLSTNTHFLLVHAEQDSVFPVADVRRFTALLQTNGIPTVLHVFPNVPHSFGEERDLLMREVAEYCASYLTSTLESQNSRLKNNLHPLSRNVQPSYWYYWLPVALLSFFFSTSKYIRWRKSIVSIPRDKWSKIIVGVAWALGLAAIAETAFHLGLPHLRVSEARLKLTRRWLIEPKLTNDFDWLAQQPIWKGQPIRALLDNVELADYNRKVINWKIDDNLYQQFVLSPVAETSPSTELNWRRPLWESFYPRIRHETDPESAAQIVVRFLRERVTVVPWKMEYSGVEEIWKAELTDVTGFERIYVAALRSVGIPARLDNSGKAELFATGQWRPAPKPIAFSLLSDNTGADG